MQLCIPGTSLKGAGLAFTMYIAWGSQASASRVEVASLNGIHPNCGSRNTSVSQAPIHFYSPAGFPETRLEPALTFCLCSF